MVWRMLVLGIVGTFLSASVEAGGADAAHQSFVWADFDGDGLQDVYVARPAGHDSLFRNLGDGSFEDVTADALPCVACASLEVVWRDVDLDRKPDLLRILASGGVELLRNRGEGAFDDVTLAAGLERVGGASGARFFDYDSDGRLDLELATQSSPLLFHNLGDFLFEAVTFAEPAAAPSEQGSPVQATLADLDEASGSTPNGSDETLGDPADPARRSGGDPAARSPGAGGHPAAVLSGSLLDKVHPDPFAPGTPPVDPLEPRGDGVDFQIPPFANLCAWSVKDTSTGDCVLTSTIPTLGMLYPISSTLFVSTGGNVGVGTTSPAAKLDVAGTARVTDTVTLAPSSDIALDVSTGSIYMDGVIFLHNKGSRNTATGSTALSANTTGIQNTAHGHRALAANTEGSGNTAHGVSALRSNTTGSFNTALGRYALYYNTEGTYNTATGINALAYNTTASNNTAHGALTLFNNTTGYDNTASGFEALTFNTYGHSSTAHGAQALRFNTTGHENTANGFSALRYNTTGSDNTAHGAQALRSQYYGYGRNTVIGFGAIRNSTTSRNNIAIGHRAGYALGNGLSNIIIGNEGTAGDNNALRIGDSNHNRVFIAGIFGSSVQEGLSSILQEVYVERDGRLGNYSPFPSASLQQNMEDIEDMGDRTERLLDLRPVVFRDKQDVPTGGRPLGYGLIAEEVAEIFPDLVVYDEEGRPFAVKNHLLSTMLLNELKEQAQEMSSLRDELDARAERLATLESHTPRSSLPTAPSASPP